MFKPNLSAAQIQSALDQVNHGTVRKVREKHFDLKEEGLTEQSIAWLFCWAKTGMNSKRVQAESLDTPPPKGRGFSGYAQLNSSR